jgi:GH24 family phage-related lysozyme (muramidase)
VDPVLESDILSLLEKHEGIRSWMYLDSANPPVVTTGCGHAIFKSSDAAALPFRKIKDNLPASPQEIIAVWSRLKYQTGSPKIEEDRSLFLLEHDIESLAMKDLARFEPLMDRTFPSFNQYPEEVKSALYDIIWQCGSFVKWPKLTAAVKAQNWEEAARQCYRPQASASRNQDTKDLFLAAAKSALDFK